VSNLTFVAFCWIALGANDPESYAQAHEMTLKTGKPMVVMVTTDWCAPCQVMKKTVIPQVRQRGLLSRVAFAIVNPDRDHDLAMKITGGGPVPQLIMFRKTHDGWNRRVLIGGQSVESVEQFINEGVTQNQAEAENAHANADTAPQGESQASDKSSTERPRVATVSHSKASSEHQAEHGEVQ
jgi:thioredoxin-like negative regulator of GroEL